MLQKVFSFVSILYGASAFVHMYLPSSIQFAKVLYVFFVIWRTVALAATEIIELTLPPEPPEPLPEPEPVPVPVLEPAVVVWEPLPEPLPEPEPEPEPEPPEEELPADTVMEAEPELW